VTILADYTGIVADTYDPNPVFGDFGVLGAYNRGALLMDSDNPSCVYPYCYLDYLILASIHSTVGSAGTTAPIAFPNATQCLTVNIPQIADSGTNLGDCGDDCAKLAGAPINVTNGNVFIKQRDYTLPGLGGGLTLERTWNSLWPLTPHAGTATARMFGDSWTSNFEERLVFVDSQTIDYWRADGSKWRFRYSSTALGADIYNLTAPQGLNADLIYFPPNPLWTNQYTVHIHENLSVREFDPSGVPAGIHDANGNRTSLTHDAQGRVVQVTDAAGRALTFTYGDPTNPTQVTGVADATGAIATYAYDGARRLTQVTYADGSYNRFTYDANSLILSVTDTDGKVLESHTYDTSRRGLTSARAGGVESLSLSYNGGGLSTLTDSLGRSTQYASTTINQRNQITSIAGPGCATCGGRGDQSVVYDSLGHRTAATDALGNTTQFTPDGYGNVTRRSIIVNGAQFVWNFTYNEFDEVLTATDPLGNTTTNTYDVNGNLLTTTTPPPNGQTAGSKTTFTYDSHGQLLTITDPLNHITTLAYTSAGLLQSVTDAQSKVTHFEYDARGNRTAVVDALNQRTTLTYDARNRLTRITYPTTPATSTQFTYDSRGRRTSISDANGTTTAYTYDDADRLVAVTDAAGTTQNAYDSEDNLLSVTDALGRVTQYQQDAQGRVTQATFPSTLIETYSYDAIGNPLSKTDRKNQTIAYSYDPLRRLTRKQYPDGTGIDYTYDPASRLTRIVDPTGTYQFAYDSMGRLTQTSTVYTFIPNKTFTVGYGWDAASNLTTMTDPAAGNTTYTYDTLNRLSTLKNPQRNQWTVSYDALSRRTQLLRPSNVKTNYQYDPLSRVTSILHQITSGKTTTTLDGATYTYDAAGNRLSRTDKRTNVVSNYGYDPVYELTGVTQGATTTESYTYDAVGNRLSSLGVAPYAYDASNELTSQPGVTYTYDGDGNLASKTDGTGLTTYAWDFDNRLTRVTLPGGAQVNFKYDPMARRIQKTSASGTVNYVSDGVSVLDEVDTAGNVVARYTQGLGIDEPLALLRSSTTSYYQADGLGSITSLTNSSGTVVNTYTYDAFGKLTASSGSITNPYRFTGREWDQETSVYYYRARYYAPTLGRFIGQDPIGFKGGDINLYAYVGGNPLGGIDPFGLAGIPPPPGPPPVPVPGAPAGTGWKWNPDPGNRRLGTWGPDTPIAGQSQPNASWDPDGHWDIDNGKGRRDRCDEKGNPLTPEQAHDPRRVRGEGNSQFKVTPLPWWVIILVFPWPFNPLYGGA